MGIFFDILVWILLFLFRWISPNFKYQKSEKKFLKTLIEGAKFSFLKGEKAEYSLEGEVSNSHLKSIVA